MKNKDLKSYNLSITQTLFKQAKSKAEILGLTFDEYLENLVKKDLNLQKKKTTPVAKGRFFYAKDEEEIRRGF